LHWQLVIRFEEGVIMTTRLKKIINILRKRNVKNQYDILNKIYNVMNNTSFWYRDQLQTLSHKKLQKSKEFQVVDKFDERLTISKTSIIYAPLHEQGSEWFDDTYVKHEHSKFVVFAMLLYNQNHRDFKIIKRTKECYQVENEE